MEIEKFVWPNGFEKWKTYMIHTPKDMHCFFHCILGALCEDYKKGTVKGKPINRKKMAIKLRLELAELLDSCVTKDGKKRYDFINGGHLSKNQEILPKEYTLENMLKSLQTPSLIGQEFFDFISDEINKDIYILHWEGMTYYKTLDEDTRIKNRRSIVLIYIDDVHYNLLMIKENGKERTSFESDHPFIKFLRTMF